MSAGPIIFTASFWGAKYREMFLRLSLASLLAPGNIPSVTERARSRFLICTTREDWQAIENDPLILQTLNIIPVEFVELKRPVPVSLRRVYAEKLRRQGQHVPASEAEWNALEITPADVLMNNAYGELEQIGQEIGIELNIHDHYGLRIHFMTLGHKAGSVRAFAEQASVFFVGADHITADGAIPELERVIAGGRRVVLSAILRFDQESCLAEFKKSGLISHDRALVIGPRDLVALAFRNLHPETAAFEFDSPYFCDTATSASWRIPNDDGILIHNLNFFPLLVCFRGVKKHDDEFFDRGGTIDGPYIALHFDPFRDVELIEDSDRLFVASLSPSTDYLYPFATNALKTMPIIAERYKIHLIRRTFATPMGDPVKRQFYAAPILLHSLPLSSDWLKIKSRAERVVRQALARRNLLDVIFDLAARVIRWKRGRRVPWPSGEIFNRWLVNRGRIGHVRTLPLAPLLRSGKWYWEVFSSNVGQLNPPIAETASTGLAGLRVGLRTFLGSSSSIAGWCWRADGYKIHGATSAPLGEPCDQCEETIMVAFDADHRCLWFGRNGRWFGGGEPGRGVNPAFDAIAGEAQPMLSVRRGEHGAAVLIARVTPESWSYEPPTGFRPLTESAQAVALMEHRGLFSPAAQTGN